VLLVSVARSLRMRRQIEQVSSFRAIRIAAHHDRGRRRNGVGHQRIERLAVAAAVPPLQHLCVDLERGRRVLVADLSLHIRDGCAGLEHQRYERAAERVGGDRPGQRWCRRRLNTGPPTPVEKWTTRRRAWCRPVWSRAWRGRCRSSQEMTGGQGGAVG